MSNLNEKYHARISQLAMEMRAELQKYDNVSRMCFRVEFDGRVHDGDLKMSYKIGEYGSDVEGGDIDDVLWEWVRRQGWKKRNNPICLPNAEPVLLEADESTPFDEDSEEKIPF